MKFIATLILLLPLVAMAGGHKAAEHAGEAAEQAEKSKEHAGEAAEHAEKPKEHAGKAAEEE